MGFFPDLNLLNYLNFFAEGFNRYLEYIYSVSIAISLLTGISGLYKGKSDRLNFVRGIFLLSVFFCIIGQGRAFSYVIQPTGTLLMNEHRIFFSYFFGFAICASFSTTFHTLHVIGYLKDPLKPSLWAFIGFPVIFIISLFLENLHSITYFGKTLVFLLQMVGGIWSLSYIKKQKLKRIYYNYPLQNFALCFSIAGHTMGLWIGSLTLVLFALATPALFVIYFFILEYNFPEILRKSIFRSENSELETELEAAFVQEEVQILNQYIPRNLLEGVNITKIDENVERFVLNREFLDEEIRLPDFSAYIGLSVHQASYYLNNYKKLSFSDFLNYHRLQTAKEMILMNQEMNLLEIALACGFNSPSSFRRACLKFEEKSPKELRNQLIREERPIPHLELQAQIS
ncbi:AraC family transcriptional regulator [Leptospira sp. 201903070]|uniref:AraC family transcriptional regulator n=1 Tax=Leptospira ainlahdjerensis TaxID=2810033 RepID=A0ABS2U603_9LEPT|nr:helix-turn-helix domain-containing protein [Leptospira ainlahdjerensis]MBM9575797.1 AraC family transcriptional regulator [Leptospira ainlahdjerensis]